MFPGGVLKFLGPLPSDKCFPMFPGGLQKTSCPPFPPRVLTQEGSHGRDGIPVPVNAFLILLVYIRHGKVPLEKHIQNAKSRPIESQPGICRRRYTVTLSKETFVTPQRFLTTRGGSRFTLLGTLKQLTCQFVHFN